VQRDRIVGCVSCRFISADRAGQDPVLHGSQISECSGLSPGTVYPALHQLRQAGVIAIDHDRAGSNSWIVNYAPGESSNLADEFMLRLRPPETCPLQTARPDQAD
jgi:hypothetical protein